MGHLQDSRTRVNGWIGSKNRGLACELSYALNLDETNMAPFLETRPLGMLDTAGFAWAWKCLVKTNKTSDWWNLLDSLHVRSTWSGCR